MTRAFDTALFVGAPVNIQDAVAVTALGPPFTAAFMPVAKAGVPGVIVNSSVPAATAAGQSLLSSGSAGFPWTVAASASAFPSPTAPNQILVSGPGPTFAWATQLQYLPSVATPLMDGAATPGALGSFSAGDHVHPTDTTRYAASNPSGFQTLAQMNAAIGAAAYTLPTASTTVLGGVKVDGSSITIASGVISIAGAAGIPDAPNDGTSYVRNGGAWSNNLDCGTF